MVAFAKDFSLVHSPSDSDFCVERIYGQFPGLTESRGQESRVVIGGNGRFPYDSCLSPSLAQGEQAAPWEENDPWYRQKFNSVDEAGTAASLRARSLTVAGGDNYEYGGEIYSYEVDGRVYYGYTTPRQGPGRISFVDSNGNTVTANRGPKFYKTVTEGTVVGYYHSHTGSGGFSGSYQGRGGDALIVTTSQKSLYMARRSQIPFSRKTVVRVMDYNGRGGTTKRTIGKF